jgi:hypothetical protein
MPGKLEIIRRFPVLHFLEFIRQIGGEFGISFVEEFDGATERLASQQA